MFAFFLLDLGLFLDVVMVNLRISHSNKLLNLLVWHRVTNRVGDLMPRILWLRLLFKWHTLSLRYRLLRE